MNEASYATGTVHTGGGLSTARCLQPGALGNACQALLHDQVGCCQPWKDSRGTEESNDDGNTKEVEELSTRQKTISCHWCLGALQ